MTWVKLDDGFADHPKIERCGYVAAWLHVVALCYSARHLTDGRIPKVKARRLADIPSPTKQIAALLEAGVWHEDGDDYVIHDYLDFQPSRATVEAERAAARERQRRARNKARVSRRDNQRDSQRDNNRESQRDTARESRLRHGPPDPTPTPNYLKGGGYLQAADPTTPPLSRCPQHTNTDGPVPPCGQCADARRTYDTWARQRSNSNGTDPYADQQAAARQRAEAGTTKAHAIASEPADSQAAAKIADLLREHRLATRKDPA